LFMGGIQKGGGGGGGQKGQTLRPFNHRYASNVLQDLKPESLMARDDINPHAITRPSTVHKGR